MSSSPSFHSIENLSPADQVLFNRFGRGPVHDIPFHVVHHAFEAIAASHPDATAVVEPNGTSITYHELDRRANMVANELRDTHGLRAGQRVVLVYSRSIEMTVFLMGVLKAGGQYVPTDGGVIPEHALGYAIANSQAPVVLCLPRYRQKVQQCLPAEIRESIAIVDLDSSSSLWTHGNAQNPHVDVSQGDGAYIIYTSGTTGTPKGVDVSHGNVTHTLLAEPGKLGICVGRKVAQQLNVAFDMCAWEILATLMNGGTLYIRGSGNDLWRKCLQSVDTVIGTPSVVLKQMPRPDEFPNMGTIVVGGEPCPDAVAELWAPRVNFYNICGPTEITILNTAHLHKPGKTLSIGTPNPNTNVYVLDDDENPVKIGEPGTMWVGGKGVSRGYVNLPELTATRYKPDKFTKDGSMMFNTGDLTRWLDDGNLVPLGRKDDQVKLKGFRIELDGVSRAIEQVPGVLKACALKINDDLWGFYASAERIDEKELKEVVGVIQPFYAVPTVWKHLDNLELTPNGKIDKKALIRLATEDSDTEVEKGSISLISDKSVEYTLPEKNGIHLLRSLRYRIFSAYRKLFGIILLANLGALIYLLYDTRNDNFALPLNHLATAVAANLLGAVLLRQDLVINLIFRMCSRLPLWLPLGIRRHFARVYHNGGVHSGCSTSASIWWLVYTVAAQRSFVDQSSRSAATIVTMVLTYMIMALLLAILIMAYPTIRIKMHDQFEWTHRFGGWSALALVWVHIIVSTAASSPDTLGKTLAKTPAIYLVALTTLSIALPWMRLRRVKVEPEPLSKHAVRLHFDFVTPPPCTNWGVRITDRPLREWHAFAAIPEPDGKGFSLIVSKAGDWTKRIIEKPPTTLWTRGTPASGVLAIAPLFKKMVLVATGSGIGPCIPVIVERKVPCRIVWSTKNPLSTYGQKIIDTVLACDPDALIWDTDERGRPDLVQLSYQMYKESGAECVAIISNRPTISKTVYQLETRGVPAFGPILDS